MAKKQEVEQKFPLYNAEAVVSALLNVNAKQVIAKEKQFDTYYMPSHKNYFETNIVSEWLRVRETDSKSSVNYKCWLPIGAEIQTHCNEFQTSVADVSAIQNIFEALDIKPIIKVFKTRNSWEYKNVEISIDCIEDLGSFIELEYLHEVSTNELDSVFALFKDILDELGAEIGLQDRRGYPYLMIEKQKGMNNAL